MKIRTFITFLAALGIFSSCVTGVDEVFDTTPTERMEAKMAECMELLTTSDNGWLIQYFPSSDRTYGGSNLVARFYNDGYVEISSDIADNIKQTARSHYSMLSSNGASLLFDTYNKYLHYWADPDYHSTNLYGGDFEWTYVGGDKKEMVFKGVKTENRIVFTALQENWLTHMNRIVSVKEAVKTLYTYRWDDGNQAVTIYNYDYFPVFTYYPDGDTSGESVTFPFIYTGTGIMFYEPVTINGITARNFKLNTSGDGFVSVDAVNASGADASVSLSGKQSPNFVPYEAMLGSWKLVFLNNQHYTNVTILEKVAGKSYVMKGLPYDVEISCSKTDPAIYAQLVHSDANSAVYLCMWSLIEGEGRFNKSPSVGVKLVYNRNSSNPEFMIKDNGVWNYTIDSFIFYDTANGIFGDQFPFLIKLTK